MPTDEDGPKVSADHHSFAGGCADLLEEVSRESRVRVEELQSAVVEGMEASWIDYIRTDTRLSIAIRGADCAQERLRQVLLRLREIDKPLGEANAAVESLEKQVSALKRACWVHSRLRDATALLDRAACDFSIEDIAERCQLLKRARALVEPIAPLTRRGCPRVLTSCLDKCESLTLATIEDICRAVTDGPLLTIGFLELRSQSISPGLWIGCRALDVEVELLDVLAGRLVNGVINPLAAHSSGFRVVYAGFTRDWSIELKRSGQPNDALIAEALETMVEFLKRTIFSGETIPFLAMGQRLWPVMGNRLLSGVAMSTLDRLEAHMRHIGFIDKSSVRHVPSVSVVDADGTLAEASTPPEQWVTAPDKRATCPGLNGYSQTPVPSTVLTKNSGAGRLDHRDLFEYEQLPLNRWRNGTCEYHGYVLRSRNARLPAAAFALPSRGYAAPSKAEGFSQARRLRRSVSWGHCRMRAMNPPELLEHETILEGVAEQGEGPSAIVVPRNDSAI